MKPPQIDIVAGVRSGFNTLKYLGQWKPDRNDAATVIKYRIYKIAIATFFIFLYLMLEMINIYVFRNDLEKVTEGSFLLITHISQSIKLYEFTKHQRCIQELMDLLNHPRFQARNQRQADILRWHISLAQFLFKLFLGMSLGTVGLWAIFPQFEKGADKWQLPLQARFPFRTDQPVAYELTYAYQIITVSISACINVSMDICISAFMICLGAQLDLLNDTLAHLMEFALLRIDQCDGGVFIINDKDHELLPTRLQREMDIIFVECVHHHWLILEFANKMTRIFQTAVLGMFSIGVLIICITMFQLTMVEPFSMLFFSMALYQMCMVVEILFYCWFGNEIILKSSDICLSVYSSQWYRTGVSFRSKLIIMMTRAQRPIQIYAWNLFVLSLTTFAAILRTSWSYFAVLRSVHSEEE